MLGKHTLDEMLAERDQLNADIQEILDRQTEGWGVKVINVEIKQVDLDHSMVRAIFSAACCSPSALMTHHTHELVANGYVRPRSKE